MNESINCRVVGSVSDWETWCRVADAETLPCDWVELRVDALSPLHTAVEIMAHVPRVPLLLTLRHKSEGGMRDWGEAERLRMAMELLPTACALDWEAAYLPQAQELVQAAKAAGVQVIASNHDFEKTPPLDVLREREIAARAAGADMVKFAFRVQSMADVDVGVELLQRAGGPLAVMGMGTQYGPMSRLLYAEHGSCLIYGYLGDMPTAPGQWSAERFYRAIHG